MGNKSSTEFFEYKSNIFRSGVLDQNYSDRLTLESSRAGNENPNWKQQIVEGKNATTSLTAISRTFSVSDGGWEGYYKQWPWSVPVISKSTRCGLSLLMPDVGAPSNLERDAMSNATSKAYRIINRLLSEFSGQVFLGELGETKRLLARPLEQSKKLIEALIHSRRVGAELAKSWLQFQFGIKPLLSDVDAILAIYNEKVKRVENLAYRVYDKQVHSTTDVTGGSDGLSGFTQSVYDTRDFQAEAIIRFAVSQSFIDAANEVRTDWASQFNDAAQLPMTAWELLPWSFLVDYVVNVSDILSAMTTSTRGVTYVSRSQIMTRTRTQHSSTTAVAVNLPAVREVTKNVPRVNVGKIRDVKRDGAPLGIPSVVFSLPGSNIRYLNIAALIIAINSQKRRS